jgi:D-hexose-6-phosphate mutarotase
MQRRSWRWVIISPMSPPATIEALSQRFAHVTSAQFIAGGGGLPCVNVRAGGGASARIYLHGAHVTHYQPPGAAQLLWMSSRSHYQPGKAIRGGVPIIFPWFGAKAGAADAPQHGFARQVDWELEDLKVAEDDAVDLVFKLESMPSMRMMWPHEFILRYRVRVGAQLKLALEVRNTGPRPFTFEEALHTYLAVSDVRQVAASGLDHCEYADKVDAMNRKTQIGLIEFRGETDRVYVNTASAVSALDPRAGRRAIVEKTGSRSTVVWNPWIEKAGEMSDFDPDQWLRMLCVETANVADDAITLGPGESHQMTATLSAGPL